MDKSHTGSQGPLARWFHRLSGHLVTARGFLHGCRRAQLVRPSFAWHCAGLTSTSLWSLSCMCRALTFFTILASILFLELVTSFCAFVGVPEQVVEEGFTGLLDFDHGKRHYTQGSSKGTGESPTGLVSFFQRLSSPFEAAAPAHQTGFAETSFETRRGLSSPAVSKERVHRRHWSIWRKISDRCSRSMRLSPFRDLAAERENLLARFFRQKT